MSSPAFIARLIILALFVSVATFAAAEDLTSEPIEWSDAAPSEMIQEDWMFQDHGLDVAQCFTSDSSNSVEAAMLEKVLAELAEYEYNGLVSLQWKRTYLIDGETPGADPRWKTTYLEACAARRRLRLAYLVETFPQIVFTKHYSLGGSHYAYTENPTDAQRSERQGGNSDWKMGASLNVLEVGADGTTRARTLVNDPDGMIRDPDVSFDGQRVLFSRRDTAYEDDFHLYEIDLEGDPNADNPPVRQLTFGPGFADIEPVYLPDGNLLFASTRCMQIVDCWWTEVSNLYMCDGEGRFLRRVSFDQVHTNYPQVLPDGRVTYTRWDYNDRGQLYPQPLFVMNYDGTAQTEYYGNNSWFPTTIMHARGIPGSRKLVAIASGHHSHQRGKLILIDRQMGTQENSGVQLIAPVVDTPADKVDAYGQNGDQFQYPYPLDEEHFLTTYCAVPSGNRQYPRPYGLFYTDADGRREMLAWDETISCNQTVPLKARPIPAVRPSVVDHTLATGQYYVQDVYIGPGLEGVDRGVVKSLRVVAIEFRAAGVGSNRNRGPAGGALVSTPVACNNGTWDVKRVLGTVPVEADGSCYFEVPAKTPLYFQLLDENGHTVQSMRSWSTLQPGELFSCLGCHEDKNEALSPGASTITLAQRNGVQKLTPFHGPARGFSYPREIQPIWDAHCIECHTGGTDADGEALPESLLGNSSSVENGGRDFSESYIYLTQEGKPNELVNWLNVQSQPPMLAPYFAGAEKSRIMTLLREGHYDVELSRRELELIACWIDLLVPYSADYDEDVRWNERQHDEYAYYLTKRNLMAEIERENIFSMLEYQAGRAPLPEEWTTYDFGGLDVKREYLDTQAQARSELPIVGRASGDENVYRNLAFNPDAAQGDPTSYPHASTNSEYNDMPAFAVRNIINGRTDNTGHGARYPSWGPHKRTDLYAAIEFGRDVVVDKIVVSIRADFPHDDYWRSATIEFSDGSHEEIQLVKTADAQTFTFAERRINSIRLTDLVEEGPLGWCGLCEVEVWGKDR
jgi:hypothetical protein